MESVNIPELVERLGSEEDAVRKMAVFKLQTNIGDPSFAEFFIAEGGLPKLRYLTLRASGNTLAYSLTSFSRLLEVDKGWEYINQDLVERVVCSFLHDVHRLMRRTGCRAGSNPPSREYPSGRHVHTRRCRLSPPQHYKQKLPARRIRLQCFEASHWHLPTIS